MTTTNTSVIKKLLLIFLIIAGLYFAKEFLIPLFIGGILATLFLPFSHWMEKRKIPKGLAVFICLLTLLAILATLFWLLGWKVSELVTDVNLIKEKGTETITRTQEYIFNHLGISVEQQTQIIQGEKPSISGIMQMLLGSVSAFFTNFLLVLAYVLFLLYYRGHIKNFLLRITAPAQRDEMEQVISGCTIVSQQYLVGMAKMIGCLWIMYGIGFSILGVPNAIFFAVLCGLFEIVPFIGNIVGTTLTVLVTALHGGNPTILIGIVATYGVVQFIQGWVLEPFIVGSQVKINALFTIIALVIGELIWGIPGIILAIPILAIFKILCDHIEPLKPYGFLIGEIETNKSEKRVVEKMKKIFK
jgi:predicted PurR-regulated permease PerM